MRCYFWDFSCIRWASCCYYVRAGERFGVVWGLLSCKLWRVDDLSLEIRFGVVSRVEDLVV